MKLPSASRHDLAIAEVTSLLKNLAKEIKTPILLLAQANRAADQAERPTMSNIKDSSAIEADADVVIFIHRDEVANPDTELKGVTELIIAKDRHNDGNGTVYLCKHNGGFKPMNQQSIAEAFNAEEVRKQPQKRQRGYARNGAT
jgi:replicative DNA helicase